MDIIMNSNGPLTYILCDICIDYIPATLKLFILTKKGTYE
jgi:hypothetical protein